MNDEYARFGRQAVSPDELFDELIESRLDWPGKTTRLARDSVQDARQRIVSRSISPAELYHENSKLYPARLHELAATRTDPKAVRREFLKRKAAAVAASSAVDATWLSWARPILRAVADERAASLLYALEIRVSDGEILARYEPGIDAVLPLRTGTSREYAELVAGLLMTERPWTEPRAIAFVVGSFVRNEVLYGARGYRRTLLEAGRLVEIMASQADRVGIKMLIYPEFHDRVVDDFVGVDGVEEGTLIVLQMGVRE